MRDRVMAKATLDQAVAMVDMEFEVFWKRKKCRLASSVPYPPVMVWLKRAAAVSRISHERLSTPSSHHNFEKR